MFLSWAVPAEILHDVDILGRVQEVGALLVEGIALGDEDSSDFLIAPPVGAIAPPRDTLPNGLMHFLVATSITREDLNIGLQAGQSEILRQIYARPEGQISDLGGRVVETGHNTTASG